jgi:SAM-dependent methyltransferase
MKCYLCGSNEFSIRSGSVRDNDSLKVMECSNCGLVQLSSFEHISKSHYEDSGMHGFNEFDIHEWLSVTQKDDKRRYDFLSPKLANKNILDFGCGCGGFLMQAKKIAKSCEGLELEKRLQFHFKEHDLKVHSSFDSIEHEQKFDLITAFHVFEHLSDPLSVLKELANLLSQNGELIIEVPSSNDALLTIYESTEFSNFTYWKDHLFLFNSKTFADLVKKAGLKLDFIKEIQRYSIANHLYWLSKGLPGGHEKWSFLDNEMINHEYEKQLASIGKCDTIIACIQKC